MNKLAIVALIAGLAACGDDGGVTFIDAPPGDVNTVGTCNPRTQTGCNAGEKCTWINDQDNPPIGHIGCAPVGTIAIGGACTDPPAGPMGYDQCVAGAVCLSGECKQICDHNGGTPTCDENHSCTIYSDFLETGGTTEAGVCDPGCDPLTQDLKVGASRTACGSAMANMPNKGCYGYDEYSCAPAGMTTWALTDRMMPRTNASGNPYLNGCAPGFIPYYYEMTGSTRTLCSGFCAAAEVYTGNVANLKGRAAALGKMPTAAAPVAGDAVCTATKKGSRPSSECKFIWTGLVDNTTGELPAVFEEGPYLDTLGVCMAIEYFRYDSDDDMMPDTPYPSCGSLPVRTAATTGDNDDAADWGCQTWDNTATMAFEGKRKANMNSALKDIRMPKDLPLEIVRHNLN